MMLSSVFLILLHLCSLQLVVVSRPTCQLQGGLMEAGHNLLRDLGGGDFPIDCLDYNTVITFPHSCLPAPVANRSQCLQTLSLVTESLRKTGQIFVQENVPLGKDGLDWNPRKVDRFREHQDRVVGETNCPSGAYGSNVLTPYFTNVTAVLRQPKSAVCGWMALRRDMTMFLKSALRNHRDCFIWRSARG